MNMQAFASALTALISVLIVIIGSDITIKKGDTFDVEDLGQAIDEKLGLCAASHASQTHAAWAEMVQHANPR